LVIHKSLWLKLAASTLALGGCLIAPKVYANRSVGPWNVVTIVVGIVTAGTPGAPNDDSGLATAAQLNGSSVIACDPVGSMYIADLFNNAVHRLNLAGIITTCAGNGAASYTGANATAKFTYETLTLTRN
jgi:hypothetical protein